MTALFGSFTSFPMELGEFARSILHNKRYAHRLAERMSASAAARPGVQYDPQFDPRNHANSDRLETWPEVAERVATCVLKPYLPHLVEPCRRMIENRQLMPGGRYLYAAGRRFPQISNCFLLACLEDSRQEWGRVVNVTVNALMTGGGVGVVYSALRNEGAAVKGMGGSSTGPCALACMVNENGRYIMQGGSRRSALWAGMHWWHPDIFKFIHIKQWDEHTRAGKSKDFSYPASMDGTNISVILDDDFFSAYNNPSFSVEKRWCGQTLTLTYALAHAVYREVMRSALETGEPGLSIDVGRNNGESLRNACTEATSRDDGDNCNLASINLARINTPQEMQDVTEMGTAFLLCGTLYGVLPLDYMQQVRERNRRIGLGVMGVHEWLMRRGRKYGPDADLSHLMNIFACNRLQADDYADKLGIARPVACRSIAPTGTISIIAETTSGIEPLFAAAYKRRYLECKTWKAQYVVDRLARQLVEQGIDPELIEDALGLAEDVDRRLDTQQWLQSYVDQGISSTINLPSWGSTTNDETTVSRYSNTLMKHLPRLRGVTFYPDGARDGQPLTRVPYREAVGRVGVVFDDGANQACKLGDGVCGS